MKFLTLGIVMFASILTSTVLIAQTTAGQSSVTTSNSMQASVLDAGEAAKIMPASVFFRGQSASIQGRNSGGVRFEDKSKMLVSLVDTSGYSSQVQEKYQAYLITESALNIEGHQLAPGAYGCGFISGDSFIVMDLGGHDLFTAHSTRVLTCTDRRPFKYWWHLARRKTIGCTLAATTFPFDLLRQNSFVFLHFMSQQVGSGEVTRRCSCGFG